MIEWVQLHQSGLDNRKGVCMESARSGDVVSKMKCAVLSRRLEISKKQLKFTWTDLAKAAGAVTNKEIQTVTQSINSVRQGRALRSVTFYRLSRGLEQLEGTTSGTGPATVLTGKKATVTRKKKRITRKENPQPNQFAAILKYEHHLSELENIYKSLTPIAREIVVKFRRS